ncbi:MAG: C69 family dipeptidase [Acidobacteriota bacterium]
MKFHIMIVLLLFSCASVPAFCCTNYLITKGASADGSTIITYVADSHELYGDLPYIPAGVHIEGTMIDIVDGDTKVYHGQIRQARETYAVIGLMNEHQVAIGETTWGGRKELEGSKGVMDYVNLMQVALQRSKTAVEAVTTMGRLVKEYGYCSSGESFSISDPNEAWIMDLIGKGPDEKGAVWVARRVPDGYISAHANGPRIRQFPLNDKVNCLYAEDVISFARAKGFYQGADKDFTFSETYNPPTWKSLRACEARVYAMFNRAAPSLKLSTDYIDGVKGAEPLPLWIRPDKKLSVRDVMELMRDHFEGTKYDMTKDVGAGPFVLPYRWRPMSWKVDGVEYIHERAASTQQTGFSFVAQSRSGMPDPIGGVLWFGVDDTFSTVYVPMYCGMTSVPVAYAPGTATLHRFSWDSAFWVFNFVANWAYSRYCDMIKDIQAVQRELEGRFLAEQPKIEYAAQVLYRESPQKAKEYLTEYSVNTAQAVVARWKQLGESLIVKYMDGNVKDSQGKVTHPPYPESWYRRIVNDAGERLKAKKLEGEKEE